jgi:hypothetical protein
MATIRLNRQAAHSGQLPRVCICCGAPAEQFVRHEFRFEPTWLILLLTAFPKLWMFLSYDTFNLNLPVCSSHTTRFKWPMYAGLATAGLLFLMLIPIFALIAAGQTNTLPILIPLALLVILGYVIARWALLFGGPRVVQYSAGALDMAGVSDAFAQHASGRGGNLQDQQYLAQQAYTGNYGLDQAAYQNAYRAPAGSSRKTMITVAIAVGVPLLVVGVVALAALGVRSKLRNRMRQSPSSTWRQQASDFKVGDTVYVEFGGWHRATVVEVPHDLLKIKYTDDWGYERIEHHSPVFVHRQLPPGAELAKPRQSGVARSSSPPREAITATPSATSGSKPPPELSLPKNSSGLAEVPIASGAVEFQPGDTAYFELFGEWYQTKIVRKFGRAYEVTYYDPDFKQEMTSTRFVDELKRNPPAGVAVISGPGSTAGAKPGTPVGRNTAGTGSKENPPGFAADELNVKKGVKIFAWWGSKWWDGEAVSTRKGEVLVHYDGWGSNFDEWLPLDRIRLKSSKGAP